ncbi:hypothetical protein C2742_03515 [Polynucleobacter paneuropaeus]|uniref:hypothetical protein n=1 Tax=Polynucleobacter paneuropaeus TaxID=2527775 RepID=UPI001BFEDBCA|nr:hypothetical protein [Polynucleobacter paneuropaeus]MBT8549733.1 hypothetical protein [Polynucleobacter paneuropaeus]QWD53229.1 hypothetical protein C2752_03465 [Polynucleobacter paneuropaeus]QWD58152.1 hypothetical protein C2742_03515 [Polynucleobacter paneuropaeus]
MKKFRVLVAIAFISSLVGCASSVTMDQASGNYGATQSIPFVPASSLVINLNPTVQGELSDNPEFSSDQLYGQIYGVLIGQYLQPQNKSNYKIEVLITDIRVRSGGSAVLLGVLAGTDYLNGRVFIKNGDKVVGSFAVDVTYALGGVMGATDTRMKWLYQAFSAKTLEGFQNLMPVNK